MRRPVVQQLGTFSYVTTKERVLVQSPTLGRTGLRLDETMDGRLIARAQQVVGVGGMEVPLERDLAGSRFIELARVAMTCVDGVRDQPWRLGVADAAQRPHAGGGPFRFAPQ